MNTTYYKRYIKGEELVVWDDLRQLKSITPANENWGDIADVMKEAMRRIKFNIDTIHERLKSDSYVFKNAPRELPRKDVEAKIIQLKERIKPIGYMPLTLEYFYRIVGSVDFIHSLKNNFTYKYTDPLCIASIEDMQELMGEEGEWEENMEDCLSDDEKPYVSIAPDFYHKDNVSGGAPYAVEVSETPQIDSLFLNTPYGEMYFIDYLRLCFEWGGFPNISAKNDNYHKFINRLKAGLMTI